LWDTGTPSGGGDRKADLFPSNHCQYDAGGWPTFQTEEELQNHPQWSIYFIRIYGGVPSTGYPICPGAFQYLWKLSAAEAGVVEFDPFECSTGDALPGGDALTGMELNPGTYFTGMSKALEGWDVAAYIYNPNFYGVAAPANTWVEVSHIVFPGDIGAIWYYMSVGSGLWIQTGKTVVYKDHPDVVSDLLGQSCSDQANDKWGTHPTECENNFPDVYSAASSKGLNTIQITDHYDCTCGPAGESSFMHYRHCYTEIIALDDPNGAKKGCSRLLRGGWEASGDCNCDESFKSAAFDPVCKDGGCSYANCGAS